MASTFAGNIFVLANAPLANTALYTASAGTCGYVKTLRVHNPESNNTNTKITIRVSDGVNSKIIANVYLDTGDTLVEEGTIIIPAASSLYFEASVDDVLEVTVLGVEETIT